MDKLILYCGALLAFAVPALAAGPRKPIASGATDGPAVAAPDDMVVVAAGSFLMGCNDAVDQQCFDNERPGRTVEVAAFAIDRTEVTVAAYRRCVKAGACSVDGLTMPFWRNAEQPSWASFCNWDKSGREQHPINCLSWTQAKTYCEWAGKRLPSEPEWEKAARGTDGRTFPWGNAGYGEDAKRANIADAAAKRAYPQWSVAEGYDDGFVGTAPVGSFPAGASPYGAVDMIGNVWEWLADEFGEGRAIRGGAWDSPPYVRTSTRSFNDPQGRYERIGVRCARTLSHTPKPGRAKH